jgi:hypothetical protein
MTLISQHILRTCKEREVQSAHTDQRPDECEKAVPFVCNICCYRIPQDSSPCHHRQCKSKHTPPCMHQHVLHLMQLLLRRTYHKSYELSIAVASKPITTFPSHMLLISVWLVRKHCVHTESAPEPQSHNLTTYPSPVSPPIAQNYHRCRFHAPMTVGRCRCCYCCHYLQLLQPKLSNGRSAVAVAISSPTAAVAAN